MLLLQASITVPLLLVMEKVSVHVSKVTLRDKPPVANTMRVQHHLSLTVTARLNTNGFVRRDLGVFQTRRRAIL